MKYKAKHKKKYKNAALDVMLRAFTVTVSVLLFALFIFLTYYYFAGRQ